MFYVGLRHSARSYYREVVPYVCPLCDYPAYVEVQSIAEGHASSPYFLGTSSGDDRARVAAKSKARRNAIRGLYEKPCPSCKEIHPKHRHLFTRTPGVTLAFLTTPEQSDEECLAAAVRAAGLAFEQVGEEDHVRFKVRRDGTLRLSWREETLSFTDRTDAIRQLQGWADEAETDGSNPGAIVCFAHLLHLALAEVIDKGLEDPLPFLMDVINDLDLDKRCDLEWCEDGSSDTELGVLEDPNGVRWSVLVEDYNIVYETLDD